MLNFLQVKSLSGTSIGSHAAHRNEHWHKRATFERSVFDKRTNLNELGVDFAMLNRPFPGFTFRLLKVTYPIFWSLLIAAQVVIAIAGFLAFRVVGGQGDSEAMGLTLLTVGLGTEEIRCAHHRVTCHGISVVLSYVQLVYEWVAGAFVILRIFRGASKCRFVFDKHAVLSHGELKIRLCSMKPSSVSMPSFVIEYLDVSGRFRPLELVNGGALSCIHDTPILLRHAVDASSPFSHNAPDWRTVVVGVQVAIRGYDDLLCTEVSARQWYKTSDIFDSHVEFEDMSITIDHHGRKVIVCDFHNFNKLKVVGECALDDDDDDIIPADDAHAGAGDATNGEAVATHITSETLDNKSSPHGDVDDPEQQREGSRDDEANDRESQARKMLDNFFWGPPPTEHLDYTAMNEIDDQRDVFFDTTADHPPGTEANDASTL